MGKAKTRIYKCGHHQYTNTMMDEITYRGCVERREKQRRGGEYVEKQNTRHQKEEGD